MIIIIQAVYPQATGDNEVADRELGQNSTTRAPVIGSSVAVTLVASIST